jgi:phage regulator Rha-like protein
MDELVILENGKIPMTNSLIIAEGMKLSHHSVTRMIDKYIERLDKMGEVVRFQIDKPTNLKGGRPVRIAWLDKKQFLFLATLLRNSETVLDFKEKLINEFERLQVLVAQLLSQRQNADWLEKRAEGKVSRRTETDTIKQFIEYSKAQGSVKPEFYYANLSKMENKALFIVEQEFKNLRDALSGQQLQIIATADIAVAKALQAGMDEGMNYRDIYQLAKKRMEDFAEIVGKTLVPMALKKPKTTNSLITPKNL